MRNLTSPLHPLPFVLTLASLVLPASIGCSSAAGPSTSSGGTSSTSAPPASKGSSGTSGSATPGGGGSGGPSWGSGKGPCVADDTSAECQACLDRTIADGTSSCNRGTCKDEYGSFEWCVTQSCTDSSGKPTTGCCDSRADAMKACWHRCPEYQACW